MDWNWVNHVPVLGAVKAGIHMAAGDHKQAEEAINAHNDVNAHVPGFDHVQALVHRSAGDSEKADHASQKADASWKVVKGALPSAITAYGAGAFVAGPTAGIALGTVTGIMDTLHRSGRAAFVRQQIDAEEAQAEAARREEQKRLDEIDNDPLEKEILEAQARVAELERKKLLRDLHRFTKENQGARARGGGRGRIEAMTHRRDSARACSRLTSA
eukprot:TRINITY_DN77372_c0_g1_i1.p1 TRINITY_DN77372_c0_g1~~TRINITY_DN77372_c0_g1_i1.p1  ORF type:complete len:238 (+),score=41.21 TRINITY_DN77372_c0_g1_i1:72-716(+)